MRMPTQSPPVERRVSASALRQGGLAASGIACDLCMAGCNELSGIAKTLCQLACQKTVC
jgi:hypothetical protein